MSKSMEEVPEWFHGAHLNYAENLLHFDDNRVALFTAGINLLNHFDVFCFAFCGFQVQKSMASSGNHEALLLISIFK